MAVLEGIAWCLQIFNSCCYQVSESWSMDLLLAQNYSYFHIYPENLCSDTIGIALSDDPSVRVQTNVFMEK